MRLVSYDGLIDVLYDNVMLLVTEFGEAYAIRARISPGDMVNPIMGIYESKERASHVLSILHDKYELMGISVFHFPEE